MEFLLEYGLFAAKTLTLLIAVLLAVAGMAAIAQKSRQAPASAGLRVRDLKRRLQRSQSTLEHELLDKAGRKRKAREEKKARKQAQKSSEGPAPRVFVLDFNGDIKASQTEGLRHLVDAVLQVWQEGDEVVLRLESPGGMVPHYGLAASQLARLRAAGVPLTVCVDKVAASGGYMMACLGSRILAAPFALIGSIGVVAQLPNLHRWLKKNDVDFEVLTAGEYKRTLTVFGENTENGREKFLQELEQTHALFKDWVAESRPQLNMSEVATGEAWYGRRALDLGLVDELRTSDDYLLEHLRENRRVLSLEWRSHRSIAQRLGLAVAAMLDSGVTSLHKALN